MKGSSNGSKEDGTQREMTSWITIMSISIVLIIGLETLQCNIPFWVYLRISRLQSKLVLSIAQFLLGNSKDHVKSHYQGFNGVKAHENGIFLYKSLQGDSLLKSRAIDYFIFFGLCSFVTGMSYFILLPLIYLAMFMPR